MQYCTPCSVIFVTPTMLTTPICGDTQYRHLLNLCAGVPDVSEWVSAWVCESVHVSVSMLLVLCVCLCVCGCFSVCVCVHSTGISYLQSRMNPPECMFAPFIRLFVFKYLIIDNGFLCSDF